MLGGEVGGQGSARGRNARLSSETSPADVERKQSLMLTLPMSILDCDPCLA